MSELIGSK